MGGYDFVIARSDSTDTIRLGPLEGVSSCTTSDNPGTAYVDVWVRRYRPSSCVTTASSTHSTPRADRLTNRTASCSKVRR